MKLAILGPLFICILSTVVGAAALACLELDRYALVYGSVPLFIGLVGMLFTTVSICCSKGDKENIQQMISHPQHTVVQWTYAQSHDFQHYREHAFGWSSPPMILNYFNFILINIMGGIFWGLSFVFHSQI
jgi:hypothetical protein